MNKVRWEPRDLLYKSAPVYKNILGVVFFIKLTLTNSDRERWERKGDSGKGSLLHHNSTGTHENPGSVPLKLNSYRNLTEISLSYTKDQRKYNSIQQRLVTFFEGPYYDLFYGWYHWMDRITVLSHPGLQYSTIVTQIWIPSSWYIHHSSFVLCFTCLRRGTF